MLIATLIYAGVIYTIAVVFAGVAAFLFRAWAHRPEDTEYRIASVMTLALAGYAYAVAVAFHGIIVPSVNPTSWRPVDLATVTGIVSAACLVHFTVRYARSAHETLLIRTSYTAAAGYLILLVSGGWWRFTARHKCSASR